MGQSGLDGRAFVNRANGRDYFSVPLLPDNKPETLALFRRYVHSQVTDTRIEFTVEKGTVQAKYGFTVEQHEGRGAGMLLWVLVTGEAAIRDKGIALFNTERRRGGVLVRSSRLHRLEPEVQDRGRKHARLHAESLKRLLSLLEEPC